MSISIPYSGFSENIISSDQILSLFDKLWGEFSRELPTYPKVIGGIHASWRDEDGHIHTVSHLNELIDAYQKKLTYDIHIRGGINNNPKCDLIYVPIHKHVTFQVTASTPEIAAQYVRHVTEMFPMQRKPIIFISYATDELALADFIKAVLNRWTENKVEVFIAKRDIKSSDDPLNVMEEKMKTAHSIIPICSKKAKNNSWVWWETATVWGAGHRVHPLFTNISPSEFGAPLTLFVQGEEYFNKDEFVDTLKTVCKQLQVNVDTADLNSEELNEYKKLSEEYIKEETSAKVEISYNKINMTQDYHKYSLIFDVINRTNKKFNNVILELYFPIDYIEKKEWNYPHLSSSVSEDKPGYLCLTFDFSGLSGHAQKLFSKFLLPGKRLRIFGEGEGRMTPLYYEIDKKRWQERFKYEVQWKVYIDGGAPQEGSIPLDSIQFF